MRHRSPPHNVYEMMLSFEQFSAKNKLLQIGSMAAQPKVPKLSHWVAEWLGSLVAQLVAQLLSSCTLTWQLFFCFPFVSLKVMKRPACYPAHTYMKQGLVIGCVCLSVIKNIENPSQTGHKKFSQLYNSYMCSHNVNFAFRILSISLLLGVSGPRLRNLSLRMKLGHAHSSLNVHAHVQTTTF